MSLDPDHPLLPILKRLSVWVEPDPSPEHKPAQDQYRHLLVQLQDGDLFDRLPKVIRTAVLTHGSGLHTSLDPVMVEIAFEVEHGREPSAFLVANFQLRLEYYVEKKPAATGGNVIPFDPPR